VPAVRPNDQVGTNFQRPIRGGRPHANHTAGLFNQAVDVRLHSQMKRGITLATLGQEVEEVSLGHERYERAPRRQMGKIGDCDLGAADVPAELTHFLVRPFEEFLQEAQFVHQFQGRRVNRVTAKITEEVTVFFQNENVDSGPCQQEAQHHPRRSAADDTTPNLLAFGCARGVFFHDSSVSTSWLT
jgi:hypothetical protein